MLPGVTGRLAHLIYFKIGSDLGSSDSKSEWFFFPTAWTLYTRTIFSSQIRLNNKKDFSVYTPFSPKSTGAWGKLSSCSQVTFYRKMSPSIMILSRSVRPPALPAVLDFYSPRKFSHRIVSTSQREMDFSGRKYNKVKQVLSWKELPFMLK